MALLLRWLIYSVAILITAYLLPGVQIDTFTTALVAALVLGILNAVLRPFLLLLTLPINILTLGLFTFVINAAVILLTDGLVDGFSVDNFWWALLFSLILSVISGLLFNLTKESHHPRRRIMAS